MPAVSVLADNRRLDAPALDALNENDSIFVEWLAEALRPHFANGVHSHLEQYVAYRGSRYHAKQDQK